MLGETDYCARIFLLHRREIRGLSITVGSANVITLELLPYVQMLGQSCIKMMAAEIKSLMAGTLERTLA